MTKGPYLSEAHTECWSGKLKTMIQTVQITRMIRTTRVIYCQSSKPCWVKYIGLKLGHRILDCQGCPSKISNLFCIWSISIYLFLCCKQFQGAKQWQFACWWFLSSKTTKLIIQRLITKQIFFVVFAVSSAKPSRSFFKFFISPFIDRKIHYTFLNISWTKWRHSKTNFYFNCFRITLRRSTL